MSNTCLSVLWLDKRECENHMMHHASSNNVVSVLLPLPLEPYSYTVPLGMVVSIGDLVIVPFRNSKVYGIVWEINKDVEDFSKVSMDKHGKKRHIVLKAIAACVASQFLDKRMVRFVIWFSRYYFVPCGLTLSMVMPGYKKVQEEEEIAFSKSLAQEIDVHVPYRLNEDQLKVAEDLRACHTYGVHVLEGVTGSGKTNVYFDTVLHALKKGKKVLILLPEIALLVPLQQRFLDHFGFKPALWHSAMTPKKRRDTYREVQAGHHAVVLGTRSSLFLPIPDLGLIIVDEEHDAGYKQDDGVCYHGRDMAILRAKIYDIPIILASATPSLETVYNVLQGRYHYYQMKDRYGDSSMPQVHVVDMLRNPPARGMFISAYLKDFIAKTLSQGKQSLIFLNRRGYAPLFLCRACGHRMMCPSCSVWLTGHGFITHDGAPQHTKLRCHYCEYETVLPPLCPTCEAEESFVPCGPGVERITEEMIKLFPEARVEMAVSDVLSTPLKVEKFVKRVLNQEVDIIVGTQMMAKGYHFPHLTCVGVVDMDAALFGPDFRSLEKSYQMISQIMGRAGREKDKGHVVLQTMYADSSLVKGLIKHDIASLILMDLEGRKKEGWAPFSKTFALIISSKDKDKAYQHTMMLVKKLWQCAHRVMNGDYLHKISSKLVEHNDRDTNQTLSPAWVHVLQTDEVKGYLDKIAFKEGSVKGNCGEYRVSLDILGPVEAPLFMLRGEFRYRLIIKSLVRYNGVSANDKVELEKKNYMMVHMLRALLHDVYQQREYDDVRVKVDIDPISFM